MATAITFNIFLEARLRRVSIARHWNDVVGGEGAGFFISYPMMKLGNDLLSVRGRASITIMVWEMCEDVPWGGSDMTTALTSLLGYMIYVCTGHRPTTTMMTSLNTCQPHRNIFT